MKKRHTALFLALVLLITTLCACGQQTGGGVSSQVPATEPAAGVSEGEEDMPINTEGTLLFDYYRAEITGDGSTYDEITIDKTEDGALYLNVYAGSRSEGTTTFHKAYRASSKALDEVMAAVKKYRMAQWEDGVGLDGLILAVKFQDSDGNMIRVSTDDMPEKHSKNLKPFQKIEDILYSYMTVDARVSLPEGVE